MVIDLKPVLGEAYKTIEHNTIQGEEIMQSVTYEVPNIEYIANGILFIFVLILMGNILLRTIFPKNRR